MLVPGTGSSFFVPKAMGRSGSQDDIPALGEIERKRRVARSSGRGPALSEFVVQPGMTALMVTAEPSGGVPAPTSPVLASAVDLSLKLRPLRAGTCRGRARPEVSGIDDEVRRASLRGRSARGARRREGWSARARWRRWRDGGWRRSRPLRAQSFLWTARLATNRLRFPTHATRQPASRRWQPARDRREGPRRPTGWARPVDTGCLEDPGEVVS